MLHWQESLTAYLRFFILSNVEGCCQKQRQIKNKNKESIVWLYFLSLDHVERPPNSNSSSIKENKDDTNGVIKKRMTTAKVSKDLRKNDSFCDKKFIIRNDVLGERS